MKIAFARKVDVFAGALVSRSLMIAANHSSKKTEAVSDNHGPICKVLVIKFLGFGSILQLTPMIGAIREAHPGARVTLLTFDSNKRIAELLPAIDEVATVDFSRGLIAFLHQTLRCVRRLRRQSFDLIVDCEFYSYFAAIVTHLVRRSHSITLGFFNNKPSKEWVFTHCAALDPSKHVSQQFMKLIYPLDIPRKDIEACRVRVDVPADSVDEANKLLRDLGIADNTNLIAININASELSYNRRWPLDSYRQLLNMLLADSAIDPEVRFILIGGEQDIDLVAELVSRLNHPRVYNVAGRISLSGLAALLEHCNLFIGNDSGPMHLAAACAVPTISLFGPETPAFYGPIGSEHRVFYSDRHCSPCLNAYFSKESKCRNNLCMQEIDARSVYGAASEAIRASSTNSQLRIEQ